MKKTVLITGGSDGLGKTIAIELSKDHNVVILSPTKEKLKSVAKELDCNYQVCDVTSWESVKKAVDEIINEHNSIDILINNAGIWIQGEVEENDPDRIKQVVDVNFTGVMLMTKAVIPQMKKQKQGQILNINSQGGLYAKAERSVYNATKWAVTGFSKSIQDEVAKYGIRVTDIHPGKMKTNMFSKMNIEKDMSDAIDTLKVAKLIRFIIETDGNVFISEVGIKDING